MERYVVLIDDMRDCIVSIDLQEYKLEKTTLFGDNCVSLTSYVYIPDMERESYIVRDEDDGGWFEVPFDSFGLPYAHANECTIFRTDDNYTERCKAVLPEKLFLYMTMNSTDGSMLYSEIRGIELLYKLLKSI